MKIMLICPQGNIPSTTEGYPSGALLLIGSILHEKGHDVKIIQMVADQLDNAGVEESIRVFCPDIVGITMNTYQTRSAREVSQIVKRVSNDILVVVGGPHPTALKLEILRDFHDIDIVVYGEGEETFLDIVNGKPLEEIAGICFGDTINPPREFIQDFDYIPLPNLDLIGGKEGIKKYNGPYPQGQRPAMYIMASRGCFGKCKFCNTPVFWGSRIRTRKPESVVSEIEWLHNMYGIKEIYFQDDTFNANKQWAETVLNLIVERGLNTDISYRLSFRVNHSLLDKDLLLLAKRANVWLIFYGTENGNQEMLLSMGKNVKIEEIERAFKLTHEVGIKTITSFLIGNMGESRKTVNDSIDLAVRLKPYVAGFSTVIPFPGTKLRDEMKSKGHLLEETYDRYGADECVIRTDELSPEAITDLKTYATYRMLLEPSNIAYIFSPRSFFGVRTKLRVLREMLKYKLGIIRSTMPMLSK